MVPCERIGLFGGTFDPVHAGHIETAAAVRVALGLDRMLLVVANEPWQKEGTRTITPAEDRFAMVAAGTEGHPGLEPSRLEIDRGGPSFTVDTVAQLRKAWPASALFLVVGADVVAGLPTWRDEADLRHQVTLVVVDRPGAAPAPVPPGWTSVTVPVEPLAVSSTELRARLDAGLPVADVVPPGVMRCIERRGLYATGR